MEIQEGYKELEALHERVKELQEALHKVVEDIEKLDDNLNKANKIYHFFKKEE